MFSAQNEQVEGLHFSVLRTIVRSIGITSHKTHFCRTNGTLTYMYWTLELAANLEDAPWPATKDELIDYADRTGAPAEVIQNLMEMDDDGDPYESIEEVWPDYPTANEDFYFEEE